MKEPQITSPRGQFHKVFRSHPHLPPPLRPPLMVLLLLLIVLLMAPHGLAADSCDLSDFKNDPEYRYEQPPKRYLFHKDTQEHLTLRLETSQRTSHRITTAIFKIFIKEILNFQNVEIVHVNDEEFNGWTITNRSISPTIEIPTTMLNLEVWLPPGTVESSGSEEVDKGSQGSGGRFGWYISNQSIGQNDCITDH